MATKLQFLISLSAPGSKATAAVPRRPRPPAPEAPDQRLEDAITAYAALDTLATEIREYKKRNPQASSQHLNEYTVDILGLRKLHEQTKSINRSGHPVLARMKFKELSEAVSKKNSEWVSFKSRQADLDQAVVKRTIENLEKDRRNMLLYFKRYQSPAEFSQKVSTAEALVDKFVLNVRSKGISAVSAGEKTGAYVTGLTAAMLTAFKKMEQKLNDDAFLKDAVHLAERPKEPLRRLGRISRFVVFEHPDLLRVLSDSSAKVARQMGVVTVPFDLVIVDPKVLDHLLDDFDNLAMVLQGAADFSSVKKEFEIAVGAAANTKGITPSKFQEKCTAALDVCREGAIKRVNARLKRELGVQATRTAYNKQMAIKVASNAAGVALGLGSMAAGGFSGGVGLVLGIISIAKSALTLFDAIVTLRMGTEKVAKALKSGVIKLSKRYQSQYKALATEAGLQTLMGLASLPQGAIGMLSSTFATVKSLKDMAGVLVGKVAGLELKSREAAIKASEALESGQGLLREFGKWYKANGARIGAEHQKALAKEVRKLRAVLDSTAKLFAEAAELGDRVKKVSAESARIQTDLDALDGMAGVKTAQTAAAVLTGLGNLALSGACASQFSLDGVGSAAAAGKKVAELLCTEVGVMNDAFFNGKDIVDALRG